MSRCDQRWIAKLSYALQSIDDIEHYVFNLSQEEFLRDRMCIHATERNLEIIGEAVNRIPDQIKNLYPHIPWADIYGMRNILSHGYDTVDSKTIWETVKY